MMQRTVVHTGIGGRSQRAVRMILALLLVWGCGGGADEDSVVPEPALQIDEEFATPGALDQWNWHHVTENWPDFSGTTHIDTTGGKGVLVFEPAVSSWYDDFHGPLLYKEIEGSFDVTTRVEPRGLAGGLPEATWSLTGIMARRPLPAGSAAWTTGLEDWVFITAGLGYEVDLPVTETKTTLHGDSELDLVPACAGWIELRAVRSTSHFVMLARCPGQDWSVRARFLRPDLPSMLQVGLIAYSGYEQMVNTYGTDGAAEFNYEGMPDAYPGLRATVDFVRFRRAVDRPTAWWDSVTAGTIKDADLVAELGEGAVP